MITKSLPVKGVISFEELKKINDHGAEYWSARDLQSLLGYSQWRRFEEAIKQEISDALAADRERLEIRKQTSEEFKALSGAARDAGVQDRMDTTELAANQFRMTQTRDKLARDRVNNQTQAIRTHEEVGKEVREAIKRIGGVMPEKIPPAEHISEVEKRIKSTPPGLELDEKDAKGLVGE